MRLRRRLPVLFGLLIFVAAIAAVVELRKHAPPEPARLLPGADGFIYANLSWMRHMDMAKNLPPVAHDPEYEQFIEATGFQFERDLQKVAVAIHYASPATHNQTRYSWIFVAHIDGNKLRAYLKGLARSVDTYDSIDIYSIPIEDRTLRVAILGVDMVAASNHDDPTVIRGIIQRSRKLASPFGGPALLRRYYKYVPQLPLPSLGWAIFKLNSSSAAPLDLQFPAAGPTTAVASVRYLGAVHFRAEAFTPDNAAAEEFASQAETFLQIFHSAEVSVGGQTPDADVKRALDSVKVEQKGNRAVLTAVIPLELIRKLVAEAPSQLSPR
jgi:hypothetical protein